MRTRARTDANHTDVVKALRAAGCLVQSLASVGNGVFDLLVCCPLGYLYVLEVKSGKNDLTEDQVLWFSRWVRSPNVSVVRSPEQALAAVGMKVRNR